MKKVLVLIGLFSLTGCFGLQADSGERFSMSATPKGMQAFADLTNGLIRTGKESAKKPSEYFAVRSQQEQQETARRAQAVGFWARLTN